MTLRLYNTLTRKKEDFQPIDPRHVRLYVCGPTVYDDAHIGNARPIIVFDVLFRLLRHLYGEQHVTYVRNITDVDDKINARATERGISIRQLTEETTKRFHDDIAALGCLPPSVEPRATDHITHMKAIVERLVARGVAYVAEDHVLFSVAAMQCLPKAPRYGALARRSLDEMMAGARVEVAPYKKDATDFVLWKPSKPDEPGWPSPCGIPVQGRPGWHIECSAMSWKHLIHAFGTRLTCDEAHRETFDIHGGGIDLVFPHHENEIAQSCCASGAERMANLWMHNGFLQIEGRKMSKSEGNFITIRQVLQDWPGEVMRFNMLKTHYRQPIDWTERSLKTSKHELNDFTWIIKKSGARNYLILNPEDVESRQPYDDVVEALSDELNFSEVLKILHEKAENAKNSKRQARRLLCTLQFLGIIRENRLSVFDIGLSSTGSKGNVDWPIDMIIHANRLRAAYANDDIEQFESVKALIKKMLPNAKIEFHSDGDFKLIEHNHSPRMIDDLIKARQAARAAKNWAESDRIRDQLKANGIVLKDNKDGTTTWE